jgi:hypothetical protein
MSSTVFKGSDPTALFDNVSRTDMHTRQQLLLSLAFGMHTMCVSLQGIFNILYTIADADVSMPLQLSSNVPLPNHCDKMLMPV